MENIFEKGCLVQLSISIWGARRKIDKNKMAEMTHNHEWLTATKKLVDPEALKPVQQAANAARIYVDAVSLRFPIRGMDFVPKDLISQVDGNLQDFKSKFFETVHGFVERYPALREAAISHLGDLFNALDYPVNVSERFSFEWRFMALDVPNGRFGLLSPEVYEREKEKFLRTMEEARELAVQGLREEFYGLVEHLTERFVPAENGEAKKFKNSTVQNFYDFFETFKERNIFRDGELDLLVTRAQGILGGTSADVIRSSDGLKTRITERMQEVHQAMADVLARPRRRIVMD